MQINRNEILNVNGLYISQLYKNWYAAECLVMRNGRVFRIRYPYKTVDSAMDMIAFLNRKRTNFPEPDYRIMIHIMDKGLVK